jgi:hypothetical protein
MEACMGQHQPTASLNDSRCTQRRRMLKDGRIVINKGVVAHRLRY